MNEKGNYSTRTNPYAELSYFVLFDQDREVKFRLCDQGEGAKFHLYDQGLGVEGGQNEIPILLISLLKCLCAVF